jgi:hypothetical protein
MLLTYFMNDFEMVPVAPFITGITLAFTFHMRCIYILSSLYFNNYIIIIIEYCFAMAILESSSRAQLALFVIKLANN